MKHNKNNGFSLVELVIVIAIMAILIGVAVPVYAAYVDKSAKSADIQMVDEIIHAIQIGAYSDQFAMGDSFKMGNISYPVGIVALTSDGTKIITSKTAMSDTNLYPETPGACEFVTVDNAKVVTSESAKASCSLSSHEYTKYIISDASITYCKAHTPAANLAKGLIVLEGSETKVYTTEMDCTASSLHFTHKWEDISQETLSNTTIADTNYLYTLSKADSSMCTAAYANKTGIFDTPQIGSASAGNPLYDAIAEVFDVSALKLKYDGWSDTEGIDFATFYLGAPDLMKDIEDLSGLLALGSKQSLVDLGISEKYEDGEAVLTGVSQNFAKTHTTLESWMGYWNNDSNMTWDGYGFGLQGRENYSAARMAYNNAFASYLQAKGETAYIDVIREFYSTSINLVVAEIGLPGLICTDTFTASNSPLKKKITNEEDFKHLAELYQEYLKSDAYAENGKLVYETLITFNKTSDIANSYAEQNGGSIYDYYNTYVAEISALYDAAQLAAGEGIVIIVTMEDGVLTFQSSPAEAIPD